MNVLIIGGVAAGTKAAAKLKREDRSADITLITKDHNISYAGCGLPYYVGGAIENKGDLIVNTPASYSALTGVTVLTGREATALNPSEKTVAVKNLADGQTSLMSYDKCIIAVGASAIVPDVPGHELEGVFTMRTPEDAYAIRDYIDTQHVRRAVVVGGGFIGLEAAENLKAKGVSVTVIDLAPQLLPNVFDFEMADYIERHLKKNGIRVMTGTPLKSLSGTDRVESVETGSGKILTDMVILSIGIRPNTAFLEGSGIEMFKGTIVVDQHLRTSADDVYAAGDCAIVKNRITGQPQWSAMGSSANYEGRTLAQYLGGESKAYPGILGTGVVKMPGLNAGRTGLTETAAKAAGYDVETIVAPTEDKAGYYPDAAFFITKLIADKSTKKLLGAQILGPGAVDKMTDIAALGIAMNASLDDFENLDLAYAPPFSTAIHPFVQAVYILQNKMEGRLVSMTPAQYLSGAANGYKIVDVCKVPTIAGAVFVDLTSVSGPIEGLDKDEPLLLVCNRGKRAYFLQNRLRHYGYTNTVVLEGASFFNEVKADTSDLQVSPEDITRVKALGFLHDKRTPNKFNARVITRNGKISSEESEIIAEAARKFGSGEITMTTRLTLEIQGIPYENIEPLREFLADAGLETGGTGSKVRPVVSCKGTTCQYGLIDTFELSQEIHERFYHGYHQVKLPHKFKIAVGGCPNNCVKPDLNDLGVIGQRIPMINEDLCRGCKVCQIEKSCPIGVAKLENGKITINPDTCNHCGRCIGKCPFKAIENYTNGYRIYIGGRWGKHVAQGHALDRIFTDKEEVLNTIEKAILLFREYGNTGERFADTVKRLGFDKVQELLYSDELLKNKEENLKAEKHLKGGATC